MLKMNTVVLRYNDLC